MDFIIHNQFFILLGLWLLTAALAAWFLLDLRKKIKILFGGDETTKADFQKDLVRRLTKAEVKLEEIEPRLGLVEAVSKISVQKVGFLRFNPFQDTGGDQSFILVLLDRENNGVLVSSLYTREEVRVYAKKVEKGKSKHQLSGEEQRVLEETLNKNAV